MTTFAPNVERWRSLVTNYADDLPVEYLLAHVRWESGGMPSSLGSRYEVGIFQINLADGPKYGGTLATLHGNFSAGATSQTQIRKLTADEEKLQVTSGVAMVKEHRAKTRKQLDGAFPEGSSDFWKVVKLQHGLPCLPSVFLPWFRAKFGAPSSWSEWTAAIDSAPRAELDEAAKKYGCPTVMHYFGAPGYPPGFGRFWNNANNTGQHGGVELLGAGVLLAIAVPASVAILAHVAGNKLPTGGT